MKQKITFLLFFFLLGLFGSWKALAQEAPIQEPPILEVLFDSGSTIPIPGGFRLKLFREGSTKTIGIVDFTQVDTDPPDLTCRFTATVKLQEGANTLTIHNACFVATSLVGHLDPIVTSCGSIPYTTFMRVHDPIQTGDATGKFAGTVTDFGYRGLLEMCGNQVVLSRGGAHILYH